MTNDTDFKPSESNFKSGLVAVVGRPNVGKSTLVNVLIENELSITSAHPHTTRRQIKAIDNHNDYQIVYVDTPGIHKPRTALGERMNNEAYDALSGVDIILAVFDASSSFGKGDQFVADHLQGKENVYVVLNKCDMINNVDKIALKAQEISELIPDAKHIFVVSAFTKKNVQLIKKTILETLEPGPAFFDKDKSIDLTDEVLVSEIYREQLIRQLRDELPQKVAIVTQEEMTEAKRREFNVKVIVGSKSHKPIIIGKSGSMLEIVGTLARKKTEAILGCPIFLRVHVEVDPDWQTRSETQENYFF